MGSQPSSALAVNNDFSKMPTSPIQPPNFQSPIPPSSVYTPPNFANSKDFNLRVGEPLGNAASSTADNFSSGLNLETPAAPRGAACAGCPGAGACGGGRACVEDLSW